MKNTLVIFAKYPEAGKVKTRLGEKVGFELSCEFYKIFLELTFKLAQEANFDSVNVYFAPEDKKEQFQEFTPRKFTLTPQEGVDLGWKLQNAFKHSLETGSDNVVVIGSDSPTLPVDILKKTISALNENELVLGPAKDGGYYLIATKEYHEYLFQEIDWSTELVLAQTQIKAKQNKLKYYLLPEWYDIDDISSLKRAQRDDTSGLISQLIRKHPAIFPLL